MQYLKIKFPAALIEAIIEESHPDTTMVDSPRANESIVEEQTIAEVTGKPREPNKTGTPDKTSELLQSGNYPIGRQDSADNSARPTKPSLSELKGQSAAALGRERMPMPHQTDPMPTKGSESTIAPKPYNLSVQTPTPPTIGVVAAVESKDVDRAEQKAATDRPLSTSDSQAEQIVHTSNATESWHRFGPTVTIDDNAAIDNNRQAALVERPIVPKQTSTPVSESAAVSKFISMPAKVRKMRFEVARGSEQGQGHQSEAVSGGMASEPVANVDAAPTVGNERRIVPNIEAVDQHQSNYVSTPDPTQRLLEDATRSEGIIEQLGTIIRSAVQSAVQQQRVYVLESDITQAQNAVRTLVEQSHV